MKKISVLMPSYNDAVSIEETLDSLINQTYKNWELILVDDGSTDNTKDVVEKYKSKKDKDNQIKYIYQENADQLNAILNGINYITGDYVYILHSDDLLNSDDTFEKCVDYMEKNPEYDAILADMVIIDENSNVTGIQKVPKYKKANYILPLQLLWLGRNLYVDMAFHKKESFLKSVKYTYVLWNMPFWIIQDEPRGLELLNVKKVDFPFFKYRIFEGNYVNSYKGRLNVINGELRTLVTIMKFYNIPFYKLQYLIFRVFNKLGLYSIYRPIYTKGEQKNKGEVVKFVIEKRFKGEYEKNRFLKVLVDFYNSNSQREIEITEDISEDAIYMGKDNAKFNNKLLDNKLDKIYITLMDEMEKGFKTIIVKNEKEKEKIKIIIKFLSIGPFVNIKVKGN